MSDYDIEPVWLRRWRVSGYLSSWDSGWSCAGHFQRRLARRKICMHDGTVLVRIGEERSEQLDIVPAKLRVIVHVIKQGCPCCQPGNEDCIGSAARPAQEQGLTLASGAHRDFEVRRCTAASPPGSAVQSPCVGVAAIWIVKLGTSAVIPIINLLQEQLMSYRCSLAWAIDAAASDRLASSSEIFIDSDRMELLL